MSKPKSNRGNSAVGLDNNALNDIRKIVILLSLVLLLTIFTSSTVSAVHRIAVDTDACTTDAGCDGDRGNLTCADALDPFADGNSGNFGCTNFTSGTHILDHPVHWDCSDVGGGSKTYYISLWVNDASVASVADCANSINGDGSGTCSGNYDGLNTFEVTVAPDNSLYECMCMNTVYNSSDTVNCTAQNDTNCWSSGESKCCGDDGTGDDWCDGTTGYCANGIYQTEPDENETLCTSCISPAGIWLDKGTGTNTGKKCCGDDAMEDFEQDPAGDGRCCFNGSAMNNGSVATHNKSILCFNGQLYDCNNQTELDNNIEDEKVSGDHVGTWVCDDWWEDTTQPALDFVNPTPGNNTYHSQNYTTINVSISEDSNGSSAFVDWNYSLVAYWSFESVNATHVFDNSTYALSTNDTLGTFRGGLSNGNRTDGKFGYAMWFDGIDDYISVNHTENSPLHISGNEITLEAWVRDPPSWWNYSWSERRKITFYNAPAYEELKNFTVLVKLNSTNFDFNKSVRKNNGSDIRFIDDDDSTLLQHHIEFWNYTGNESWIWVKVPRITSKTDYIWMYYNNSEAPDSQNISGTFDRFFRGVWHLGINATGGVNTSTTTIHASYYGNTSNVTYQHGKIDGGAWFNASKRINLGQLAVFDDIYNESTIEIWFKANDLSRNHVGLVSRDDVSGGAGGTRFGLYLTSAGKLESLVNDGNQLQATTVLSTGTWYYAALRLSNLSDNRSIFLNGELNGSSLFVAPDELANAYNFTIGRNIHDAQGFNGTIDEVRISNVSRSDAWINASYLSMNGEFLRIGDEEEKTKKIVSKGRDTYSLEIRNGTQLYGYINHTAINYSIDEEWHHVALTYDGGNMRLYIDAVLKNSKALVTNIPTNKTNLTIGEQFSGELDEIRIWKRALTQPEINASYNASTSGIFANITNLIDGRYEYYAFAIDLVGHSNITPTRVIAGIDTKKPGVKLNAPSDGIWTTNQSVIFNCSMTDNIQLNNATLYGSWGPSGWHANETNVSVGGTSNETIFSKNLSEGEHTWNCYACDAAGNCNFSASNWTVGIDLSPPTVSEINVTPTSEYNGINWTNSSFLINATVYDAAIINTSSCRICVSNETPCTNWSTGIYHQIDSRNGQCWNWSNNLSVFGNVTVVYINVSIEDKVCNVGGGAEITRTIDNDSPVATQVTVTPSHSGYTNATPYLNATITDVGAGVTSCEYSLDNGTTWGAGTWNAVGSDCYVQLSSQTNGYVMNVTFRGTDNVTHVGTKATDVQRTVDAQAPTVQEVRITPTHENNEINWTNSTMFVNATITGTGSGINESSCEICNSTSSSCTTWTAGTYSNGTCYGWIKPYVNGTVIWVNVRIMDNVTNLGTGTEVNRTVDNATPLIRNVMVYPDYESTYTNSTPYVNATITDSGAGVSGCHYSINNGTSWSNATWNSANNECYATVYPGQFNGTPLNVTFRGNDSLGKMSPKATAVQRWVWNSSPKVLNVMVYPTVEVSGVNWTNSTPYINVSIISGGGISGCNYSLDNCTTWHNAYYRDARRECYVNESDILGQAHGTGLNITFRAIDYAAQWSNNATPVSITVDNSSPVQVGAPTVVPSYRGYTNSTPQVNVSFTDTGAGVNDCFYSLDNGTSWYNATWNSGDSQCSANITGQIDNFVINVTFRANDSIGNIGLKGNNTRRTVDNETPEISHMWVVPSTGTSVTNFDINMTAHDAKSEINVSRVWVDVQYFKHTDYGLSSAVTRNLSNVTFNGDNFNATWNGTWDDGTTASGTYLFKFTVEDYVGNQKIITGDSVAIGYSQEASETNWTILTTSSTNNGTSCNSSAAGIYVSDFYTTSERRNESLTFAKYGTDPTGATTALAAPLFFVDIHSTVSDTGISEAYVRFYYTTTELSDAGVTDESSLSLYYWNPTTSAWQQVTTALDWINAAALVTTDDVALGYAGHYYINTTHLSTFGLTGTDNQDPIITRIVVHPNPVIRGHNITINVTVSDKATGDSIINYSEFYIDYHDCANTLSNCTMMRNLTTLNTTIEEFTYSYNTTNLSYGVHTLWVRAGDRAGNEIEQAIPHQFTVIGEGGIGIMNSSPSGFVNSSDQFLNVSTDMVAHCSYSTQDQNYSKMIGFTTTNATSHSVNVSSLLFEGTNIFYVRCANDSSGYEAMPYSITINFVLDTQKPVVLDFIPAPDAYTNDKNISFSIGDSTSGVNLSSITVRWNGTRALNFSNGTDCTENAHGGYNCTYDEYNITEGSNNVTLDVSDLAGNPIRTFYSTFTYDISNPSVVINHPANGSTKITRYLTLNVSTNEAADCRFGKNHSEQVIGYDALPDSMSNISNEHFAEIVAVSGANTYYVACKDLAGNEEYNFTTFTVSVAAEVEPPAILNVSPNGIVNSTEQFLNVSTDMVAHCSYSTQDQNYSKMTGFTTTNATSHSVNVSSLLFEGINILYVRCANDSTGYNPMAYSVTIDFILDTNPPVLLSVMPAYHTYTHSRNVSFSIADSTSEVNLSSIVVKWNDTTSLNFSTTHCSENAHGGYNCSYDEENITEGRNNISIDAKDLAQNSMTTARVNFTYDTTLPTLSTPKPDSGQTARHFNVSITTNEQSTCRYAFDNVSWEKMGYRLTEVESNVHQDKGDVDKNGNYKIYFRCRDLAGNEEYFNTAQFNVDEEEAVAAPSITIGGIEEDYRPGELVTIYASLTNKTGERLNYSTYCNVTVTHWNSTALVTDLDNVEMNFTGEEGWYYYLWTIPDAADFGSYGVLVRADPNEVDTQATSGFHVAEWAKEIGFLWEVTKRTETNTSVIHNESIISANLSSQYNITLWYNITIPLKEGYTSADYLPVRWKFWFVDVDTNMCVDQSREQRYIEPYCNPLVAQIIGLGNSTYEVNISIRPSLAIGNYTLIRELEVDPEQVWIGYGHGPIGKITVLEDNTEPVVDTDAKKEEEIVTTVTTTTLGIGGQCIELLMPVTTTVTTLRGWEVESRVKVIDLAGKEPTIVGAAVKKEEKKGNLLYPILVLGVLAVSIYLGFGFVKERKEKEKRKGWWEKV